MAAIATAYSVSQKHLEEYQDKVVEMFGEDKAKEVKDKIAQDKVEKLDKDDTRIERTGFGDYLCVDLVTGRQFRTTQERVYQAFKRISDNLVSEPTQTLNDLYNELNLASCASGNLLGWTTNNWPLEPTFSTTLADSGEPCLAVDYDIEQVYDFRDY